MTIALPARAKLNLDLSGLSMSQSRVRFHYSAVDPALITNASVPGATIPRYDPGSTGHLRKQRRAKRFRGTGILRRLILKMGR